MPQKTYTIEDLNLLIETHFFMWKFPHKDTEFNYSRSRITVIDINGFETTTCLLELKAKAKRGNFNTVLSKSQQTTDCMDDWKDRCNITHQQKYDYSLITSKNFRYIHDPHKIICPLHGEFSQRGNVHLRGHGCPKCSLRAISFAQIYWLLWMEQEGKVEIRHALNDGEFKLPGTNIRVDGYCEQNNTVYEFYGDAYHGNPNVYQPGDFCSPRDKSKTAAELFQLTKQREQEIKSLGYRVEIAWESDWNELLSNGGIKLLPEYQEKLNQFKIQTPGERVNEKLKEYLLKLVSPNEMNWHVPQELECLVCGIKETYNSLGGKMRHLIKTNRRCMCQDCRK